jgi:hypothetical protein
MCKFNEEKFLANVQKIHLKSEEVPIYSRISDSEVRKTLNEFVGHDNNPRFSAALDEICANIVGRTMFKLLMAKMKAAGTDKIKIISCETGGSGYEKLNVYINLNRYDEKEVGFSSKRYYHIGEDGQIHTKLKSLSGSMFHEFCHALHDVSGTEKLDNILCEEGTNIAYAWDEDEELRTITCFEHDPICDHCFDFVQSNIKGVLFYPRYSHRSYKNNGNKLKEISKQEKLQRCFSASKKYMDGWLEYVI